MLLGFSLEGGRHPVTHLESLVIAGPDRQIPGDSDETILQTLPLLGRGWGVRRLALFQGSFVWGMS